jgi:hypothetical protein
VRSTLFFGPQFGGNLGSNSAYSLILPSIGQPCLLNIGNSQLQQTAGGMTGRDSFGSVYFGGTLVCVDSAGTGLGMKTFLPAGGAFSSAAAVADGSILLAGSSQSGFPTTPGVVQPRFGGGANHDQFYAYNLNFADSLLVRLSLSNPTPRIASLGTEAMVLAPNVSGTFSFDVYGSGFASGMDVTLSGRPVTASFLNSGRLTLSVPYDSIQPGPNRIAVTLGGPGGGTAEATFQGINPTPYGVVVSPASTIQGSAETKVVVYASNLISSSTLYWNGQPRAAQFVPDSFGRTGHLELVLPATDLTQPGQIRVAIGNPAPGGGPSPDGSFTIMSSAGTPVPTLTGANIWVSGELKGAAKFAMIGTGFTTATKAFWDGVEIPVEFVAATRINIQPPAADLNGWSPHDVYVSNGSYRSLTVRQYVGHNVAFSTAALTPTGDRLYAVSIVNYPYTDPADLLVFDARTGELLRTVTAIAASVAAMTISSDGRYVYLVSSGSTTKIVRYDTSASAVDLEWAIDIQSPLYSGPDVAILAVPDSPESLIVWTAAKGLVVYDRDQPRRTNYAYGGFAVSDRPGFATASRIYLADSTPSCWRWMEYDSAGISGGAPVCSLDMPPHAIRDGGFVLLTDGPRAQVVAGPAPTPTNGSIAVYAVDLPRRRIELFSGSSVAQLTEYNLDTGEQTRKAQVANSRSGAIFILPDGSILASGGYWLARLP